MASTCDQKNFLSRHGTTYFEGYKKAGLFQHFSGRKRGSFDDLGTGEKIDFFTIVHFMLFSPITVRLSNEETPNSLYEFCKGYLELKSAKAYTSEQCFQPFKVPGTP